MQRLPAILSFGIMLLLEIPLLRGQFVPQGFPIQSQVFDAVGETVPNQSLFVRFNIGSLEGGHLDVVYSEIQEIRTDAQGFFTALVGTGSGQIGTWDQIPWWHQDLWLDIGFARSANQPFRTLSSQQLLHVPYAQYAQTAGALANGQLRSSPGPSIYWSTSGNYMTRPPYHFLGSRDEEPLFFKTNNQTRMVLSETGQMTIYGNVSGGETLTNSHSWSIYNGQQGMLIKTNTTGNTNVNFMTFADPEKGIVGRVEGMTLSEWHDTWEYRLQNRQYDFKIASLVAQIAAMVVQMGIFATPSGAAGAGLVMSVADLGLVIAGLVVDEQFFNSYNDENVGIYYGSGGADYGEYLPRVEAEPFFPGQVVGIRAGQVTLETTGAEICRVVSRQSAFLGNRPATEEDASRYETIAFLGQVPTWVIGPVQAGDYILPSGLNDGFGRAVHPDSMQWSDYGQIVGVAWEEAPGKLFNVVNVAVGLNVDDFAAKVDAMNKKLDAITYYLLEEDPAGDFSLDQYLDKVAAMAPESRTDRSRREQREAEKDYRQLLEQHEGLLKETLQRTRQILLDKGVPPEVIERNKGLFTDPVKHLNALRKDPELKALWPYISSTLNND